jgi:hypothetical protein
MLLIALLASAGSAGTTLLVGVPLPRIPDESSYLLAADTFAHGRLSNPPHPMWVHFETFGVLYQPTYASKFPPAQGLALAFGQAVTGYPIVGVWLSAGVACAAIYWMLLAWVPPWWALLGGMLAVLQFGIGTYWSHSYWGGFMAAAGGALVFGALRRLVRRPHARDAVLMGVGIAVLANSRPYESLLLCLPTLGVLGLWIVSRQGPPWPVSFRRILIPLVLVLGFTGGAMAFYNFRVTGNALRTPPQVLAATYGAPVFIWEPLRPEPVYRHKVIRDLEIGYERALAIKQRTVRGFLHRSFSTVKRIYRFYVGALFTIPLLMLPWMLRDRWVWLLLATCGLVIAGVLAIAFGYNQHYAAPLTGPILILVIEGMRHLFQWRWRGLPLGQLVVWAMPAIAAVTLAVGVGERAKENHSSDWNRQRARILAQLMRADGRQLVIVRYAPAHRKGREWVYNAADIDGAKVVWAREMDRLENQRLLEYFKDRRAWLLQADAKLPALEPYPIEGDPAAAAEPRRVGAGVSEGKPER